MATIAERLASSLDVLKQVQQGDDFTITKSSDLSCTHIKRLVDNHFLQPIIKGWYVVTDPRAMQGDSTAWHASFWNFITRYVNERYSNEWYLSAEQSLSIFIKYIFQCIAILIYIEYYPHDRYRKIKSHFQAYADISLLAYYIFDRLTDNVSINFIRRFA